jgi:hypothetical protein
MPVQLKILKENKTGVQVISFLSLSGARRRPCPAARVLITDSSTHLGFSPPAIVLKTKPVWWFDQKKPEPKPSPVF